MKYKLYDKLTKSIKMIQWKPLNMIALGQMETDNVNQMITSGSLTHKNYLIGRILGLDQFDYINRMN
jgi:hypothetical protein